MPLVTASGKRDTGPKPQVSAENGGRTFWPRNDCGFALENPTPSVRSACSNTGMLVLQTASREISFSAYKGALTTGTKGASPALCRLKHSFVGPLDRLGKLCGIWSDLCNRGSAMVGK